MKTVEAIKRPAIAAPPAFPKEDTRTDEQLIAAVKRGKKACFEILIKRYQGKIFGTVRRYARRDSEIEDIAQEIFLKAFQKLGSFRGEAPFEHWLMRMAVRTCYDFLRQHQRNREFNSTDVGDEDCDWIERAAAPVLDHERAAAARDLVEAILKQLSPAARMVITLLEIEERSVKEISKLTGWSETLVKVRAFRARAEMKKALARMPAAKYL
jgi:RNA polymerase sigma-70 factor (ECF subfamily)